MIGDNIRQLRKGQRLTLRQLATKVGVSHVAIHEWESGKKDPRPKHRLKLCEVFNVREADLFV